ncbi:hypothetical protein BURK1_00476 [Burkholderiales bacterium]|nr:hypothetical protein BURK1_00476 [Burkholderiales bacterium]
MTTHTNRRASFRGAVAVAMLAAVGATAGCAYPPRYDLADSRPSRVERVEYGVVERIELARDGTQGPISLGAVVGGIAGGVIGHQIGSGRGNTAATIAGALGGALVGNEIEKSQSRDHYRVVVRLDSGAMLMLADVGEGELRPGDRVRIVNNRAYRA